MPAQMPRGVHVERATFKDHYSVRLIDSNGVLIYHMTCTDAVMQCLPLNHVEQLGEVLNNADRQDDDTPPYGIKLLA